MEKTEHKVRVIIADDSRMFLDGVMAMFHSNDKYKVIEVFENGADLIASEMIHQADIILIDINMPKVDGIRAAQKINFQNANIPLVAVTMHKDEVYLQDIISAGFKAFIYKPNIAESLFTVIDRVLNDEFVFPANLKT